VERRDPISKNPSSSWSLSPITPVADFGTAVATFLPARCESGSDNLLNRRDPMQENGD